MSYSKQIKQQKRKEMRTQKKAVKDKRSSSYSSGAGSTTMYLMGCLLLIGYINNSTQVNAFFAGLL